MSHAHENSQGRPGGLARGRVKDPFWAAVQRRHPEIDIVLLPPEEQSGTDRADGERR
ncbi:hypothetical protein G5C66_22280 [Nocardioides sp. KC13]|uniref:Uncharacterized protein n=1 Tax=Nocardioides turkmenicus TaxID=2711220 RepID=A0A6M1R5B1_9ACTN|nr:hypothetical protein [Nocardioides sp. KC13]NGN95454.1 hypothetical protein [Nocardioides sp. KC13]